MKYGRVSIEGVRYARNICNRKTHIRITSKVVVRVEGILTILRYFVGNATIKNIQEKYRESAGNNGWNGGEEP